MDIEIKQHRDAIERTLPQGVKIRQAYWSRFHWRMKAILSDGTKRRAERDEEGYIWVDGQGMNEPIRISNDTN